MKFLDNIKNVKKNFRTIQQSPYASLNFKYKTTLTTIVVFSLFVAYQIVHIVLNYSGSSYMAWIQRVFTLCIGALIIFKAFQSLAPLKRAMEPYKKNRELINHSQDNGTIAIDDILSQFDDDDKRVEKEVKKDVGIRKETKK